MRILDIFKDILTFLIHLLNVDNIFIGRYRITIWY